ARARRRRARARPEARRCRSRAAAGRTRSGSGQSARRQRPRMKAGTARGDQMTMQREKAERFRELHQRDGAFVIPNPWDAGSARLLEGLGFEALATTSSGFAQALGRLDGSVTLAEKLEHCRALTRVTTVPVSADLENGYADDPAQAAQTIVRAAEAGVVGGSIEDYSGTEIYPFDFAVERVRAAVQAARSLDFPFTLTARAENLI